MMQTSTDSRSMPADTILSLGKRSYEEKPVDCKLLSTEKERPQPFPEAVSLELNQNLVPGRADCRGVVPG
jgi:hypothetical protein